MWDYAPIHRMEWGSVSVEEWGSLHGLRMQVIQRDRNEHSGCHHGRRALTRLTRTQGNVGREESSLKKRKRAVCLLTLGDCLIWMSW